MTNHVHMLLQVADAPLGRIMLRIAGRYARTVQKRLHTTGHLFEKRYYPVLIDADEYLLGVIRYIHLNPLRARMVRHPSDYPWSSHSCYLGRSARPWVTTDFALNMFHAERDRALAAYQRFVDAEIVEPGTSPLDECNPSDRRILGSDEFAAKILGTAWRPRSRKTLHELMEEACLQFCVSRDALTSRSAERKLTKARAWVAHQCLLLRIATLSEVARTFNRRESSLRESVKRHFGYP